MKLNCMAGKMIRGVYLSKFCFRTLIKNERSRTVRIPLCASAISQSSVQNVSNVREKRSRLESKKKFSNSENENYEDTFGNLESFERNFVRIKDDPEDVEEYERLKAAPGKNLNQYINEVKERLNENNYKAALKLVEVDARNDGIRASEFLYRLLISYNAVLGDLEEAYRLFVDYKRRGGIVCGPMFTSMFNACANCKNSHLALEKIEAIREYMDKNEFHKANITNLNALMKAYGRHCHIGACLKLMDKILEERGKVKSETYAFLFQACASDSNSGLRQAFLVWRKMLQNMTKPCIYCFNLMLRCVRDCSLGEVSLIPDFIKQVIEENQQFYKRKINIKKIGSKEKRNLVLIPTDGRNLIISSKKETETKKQPTQIIGDLKNLEASEPMEQKSDISESLTVANQTENCINISEDVVNSVEAGLNVKKPSSKGDHGLPNLLALEPTMGSVVDFSGIARKEDRFLLVGGVDGFLKTMTEFGVKPNLQTFGIMLSLIPHTVEAEEKLISVAESLNLELDIGFYNILMRRRIMRGDKTLIKDCLDQMLARSLKPDIITFGTLALTCDTHELGIELLENLHTHGFRLNCVIVHILLRKADIAGDMKYLLTILRNIKKDDVKLTPKCLAKISYIMERRTRQKNREIETTSKSLPQA